MGQCSPHLLSSSAGLLLWGLFSIRAWGIADNLGGIFFSASSIFITVGPSVREIGQDALASNKFVEACMVIGHGKFSLFCGVVAVTAALGCCFSWGLLQLGVERPSSSWGFPVG